MKKANMVQRSGGLFRWSAKALPPHWVCLQAIWVCASSDLSCGQAKEVVLLPIQWRLGLCSTAWSLRCICTAAISGLCLKCSMCFPTDKKCYGPLWFSCLLEMHIILFYVLELFYGKVKGSGRLFCNLFTLVSILYLFCTSVLFTAYAVILNSCYISSPR